MTEFSYHTHLDLSEQLLKMDSEAAFRTVVNRSYLSAAMIVYESIRSHVGSLPKDQWVL